MSLSGTRKSAPRKVTMTSISKAQELRALDREEREKRIRLPYLAFLDPKRRLVGER